MNIKYLALILYSLFVTISNSMGQKVPATLKNLSINKIDENIKINGILNESVWKNTQGTSYFNQVFPSDSIEAENPTRVKMLFDEEFLYIGIKCMDVVKEGDYVITSLKRDYRGLNDGITVILDPFGNQTTAYMFGLSPFNVKREGLITGGGGDRGEFSLTWDCKWIGKTKTYDGYWTGEMAIPLKSIKYKNGVKQWKGNFYRIESKTNERSSWIPIPRNFGLTSLAFMGDLIWDHPPKNAGNNISVIPYAANNLNKDFSLGESFQNRFNAGGDLKFGLSPSLNLDATINPDFSQAEADEQIANLNRFNIQLPEKRQFFLENADLFGEFGTKSVRPFFSRRIGLVYDSLTNQYLPNTIYGGLRLNGNIDNNWRVGLLNMQSARHNPSNSPASNYGVMVAQRKLFDRSNISGIFVNKQSFYQKSKEEGNGAIMGPFNRVAGLDYNHASKDGSFQGNIFYHRSFSSAANERDFAHGMSLIYQTPQIEMTWYQHIIGPNYTPEVGFMRYDQYGGYRRYSPSFAYTFFPASSSIINNHGPGIDLTYFLDTENRKRDHEYELIYTFEFQNSSDLEITLANNYTWFLNDFDLTRNDGQVLKKNSNYTYNNLQITYESNSINPFFVELEAIGGQYFNGKRYGVEGNVNYRFQPYGMITLNLALNTLEMPEPYQNAQFYVIGPQLDLTFSRSLFWSTYVQYNSQFDNLNINSRLQWRYAPVSDLFIVYTDNYFSGNMKPLNRSLVVKMTYWLNL